MSRTIGLLIFVALSLVGCYTYATPERIEARFTQCDTGLPTALEDGVPSAAEAAKSAVIVVLDMSEHAFLAAGFDVDGDGMTGRTIRGEDRRLEQFGQLDFVQESNDLGDTRLNAQLVALERALQPMDPMSVRVGLVGFAGDDYHDTSDVKVLLRPTASRASLQTGIEQIRANRMRFARTNLAEALWVAGCVLERDSASLNGSGRLIVLSDGHATGPLKDRTSNHELAVEVAARLARSGTRVDVYALPQSGSRTTDVHALNPPRPKTSKALQKIADAANGVAHPIADLRELGPLLARDLAWASGAVSVQ